MGLLHGGNFKPLASVRGGRGFLTNMSMSNTPIKYEYKPEYKDEMIKFFDVQPYTMVTEKVITDKGKVTEKKVMQPHKLPFFSQFARSIGVPTETFTLWRKKYPEFGEVYEKCKEIQKEFLIENSLNGLYNPITSIFTAKNITDMRDKNELEVGGRDGKPIKIHLI